MCMLSRKLCTRQCVATTAHMCMFKTKCKNTNLRMWIQNEDQNNKIRRRTKNSSCQTTTATKNTITTMMGISICAHRTLILVSHWHIDFLQKCKQSMCECGAKAKMEMTDSDDKQQHRHAKTTTAVKNDHDGRCQSAFVHVELSF